jgi:flagellar biosynthesis anti-sigma factor FlgM
MEIKNTLLKAVDPYRAARGAKDESFSGRARNAEEAGSYRAQNDRVSLSSSALMHKAAHAAANQAPDIRRDKVEGVKERLVNGEYTVDAKCIAKKLLESDALLAASLERKNG